MKNSSCLSKSRFVLRKFKSLLNKLFEGFPIMVGLLVKLSNFLNRKSFWDPFALRERRSLCKEFDGGAGGTGCSELYRTAHRCSNANPIFRLRFFSINWKCESTTQGDTDEKCESLEPTNWEIRDIANIYIKSEHISQTA